MTHENTLKIKALVAELTGIEPLLLTNAADFEADLNLNANEISELLVSLEERLGIEIDNNTSSKIKTFGGLVTIVCEKLED